MKLLVISFGKLKAPGLRDAADYYLRLAQSFGEIEEIELKPVPLPDKAESSKAKAQAADADTLLKILEKRTGSRRRLILLDERGGSKSTQDWARLIGNAQDQGTSELVFCIGSSVGFAPTIREMAQTQLSLGAQTLPHELARVVLLEQVFRSLSVLKGHPYHNEG